jgi:hypothetical protein
MCGAVARQLFLLTVLHVSRQPSWQPFVLTSAAKLSNSNRNMLCLNRNMVVLELASKAWFVAAELVKLSYLFNCQLSTATLAHGTFLTAACVCRWISQTRSSCSARPGFPIRISRLS